MLNFITTSCNSFVVPDGCDLLKRIILHNDYYIDDRAIKGLSHGKLTLLHVQVSKCPSVTDRGLKQIDVLKRLQTLVLFDLQGVSNLEECKQYLLSQLPNCNIKGKLFCYYYNSLFVNRYSPMFKNRKRILRYIT